MSAQPVQLQAGDVMIIDFSVTPNLFYFRGSFGQSEPTKYEGGGKTTDAVIETVKTLTGLDVAETGTSGSVKTVQFA